MPKVIDNTILFGDFLKERSDVLSYAVRHWDYPTAFGTTEKIPYDVIVDRKTLEQVGNFERDVTNRFRLEHILTIRIKRAYYPAIFGIAGDYEKASGVAVVIEIES